jgi:hypothetical protein
LKHDGISGDYAQNFFGYAINTATYFLRMREFGWQVFGGAFAANGTRLTVTPRDAFRTRVYLAPVGLWLTLDAGTFARIEFDSATNQVRAALGPSDPFAPVARLRLELPARVPGIAAYVPRRPLKLERGAYVVPLGSSLTWVELAPSVQ